MPVRVGQKANPDRYDEQIVDNENCARGGHSRHEFLTRKVWGTWDSDQCQEGNLREQQWRYCSHNDAPKHGVKDETEAGITMKLKRGTFAATFFLACLAAMELEGVVLEET